MRSREARQHAVRGSATRALRARGDSEDSVMHDRREAILDVDAEKETDGVTAEAR